MSSAQRVGSVGMGMGEMLRSHARVGSGALAGYWAARCSVRVRSSCGRGAGGGVMVRGWRGR